jgi:hypothetical protein
MIRRERAILMSFILLPLAPHEKGRRAAEIVRTSHYAFRKLGYSGSWDRLKLACRVSNDCRRLVKMGFLEEAGRVWHTYDPDPYGIAEIVYLSPQYRPTEAGFSLALSMNWSILPDLRAPKKKKRRRADKNPYTIEPYDAARAFIRSIE